MLKNIRVILIKTSQPGNIGAAARAMKTMGISELYLVSPHNYLNSKDVNMASNAADVLEKAVVVSTLSEATTNCELIVGIGQESQTISCPIKTPREFAEEARNLGYSKIAVIFGNELSELTNDEMQHCHYQIQIPSNPECNSLNLAAAVQVIAYELCVANQSDTVSQEWDYRFATNKEMECFYEHFKKILIQYEFLKPETPSQLMTRLQRLFDRVKVDELEVKMLRGILGAMEKKDDEQTKGGGQISN